MEQTEKLLKDYSDVEKGSYLGAIASIATADRAASEEELEYIRTLADSAELSPEQKEAVERAATELSGEELKHCLDLRLFCKRLQGTIVYSSYFSTGLQ